MKGINHTPTLIELHQTHAKILSWMGNLQKAVDAAKEAKQLDEGDRFLNAQLAKYIMKLGN